MSIPFIEENDQTRARHEHLEALRGLVGNVYPNKFERSQVVETGREDTITSVAEKFRDFEPKAPEGDRPPTEAIELANQELNKIVVRLAGRIASPPRVMGKAAFVHLSDGVSRLQIYIRKADARAVNNDTGALIELEGKGWKLFELLDHGDFIGVEGYLFVTKTGELTVHVEKLQFLAKALLPLPDKMHGIHDPEMRRRQRYADLIAGSLKLEREEELTSREVFERRSRVIREMRSFLDNQGYIEVETPMLSPLATGAAARPFKTHHNALDIDLYARIAPELYLKRLLVGGFEKVYELNRNFRNEGIGYRWNPEFTMLEFYCAYLDVNGMMDLCEDLIRANVFKVLGQTHVKYGEHDVDFAKPFERLTMKQAIIDNLHPSWHALNGDKLSISWLDDPRQILRLDFLISKVKDEVDRRINDDPNISMSATSTQTVEAARVQGIWESVLVGAKDSLWREAGQMLHDSLQRVGEPTELESAQRILGIFEDFVESKLRHPTFIYDFPKPVSPLSKASPANSSIAERFELFIAGMECANGFSELNDPREQFDRFKDQVTQRERGDEEAMLMDEDYIRALSYGMPPAAGIGIGVDRFVMLLTNRPSIRDVILFPHMRPERKPDEPKESQEQDI